MRPLHPCTATKSRSRRGKRLAADQVGGRNDRGRSISLSGQLLGPARRQRGGRHFDRTADLSHLRRHGPRDRGNRRAPAIRASSFSTAISWTIRAARKRSPRRFQARASSWSPPIPAPISSSPTSSIRSSAASPASPTPRLSSRRSIWSIGGGAKRSKAWRAATTSV